SLSNPGQGPGLPGQYGPASAEGAPAQTTAVARTNAVITPMTRRHDDRTVARPATSPGSAPLVTLIVVLPSVPGLQCAIAELRSVYSLSRGLSSHHAGPELDPATGCRRVGVRVSRGRCGPAERTRTAGRSRGRRRCARSTGSPHLARSRS